MKSYCEKCDKLSTVKVKNKDEVLSVKGDKISIVSEVAICNTCGLEIFCLELDEKNLKLAYSLYREKHSILSSSQIANIRKKYMLSQRALGKLLEWGEITINRYENGAIQDAVHNEVLMFIEDPGNMKEIFEKKGHLLSQLVRDNLEKAIVDLIRNELKPQLRESLEEYISSENSMDEYSGFNEFNLEKTMNMILYIVAQAKGVFTTKLNKLLWYIDYLNFKEYSTSISGCAYIHDKFGPVPKNYSWLLAATIDAGFLVQEEVCFPSGSAGIVYKSSASFDDSYFKKEELEVMNYVIKYFKNYDCMSIKDKSHTEDAYIKTKSKEKISYKYAPSLSISLDD